jgi:aminoglycoside phosphotransferase (APT) family kinase protein
LIGADQALQVSQFPGGAANLTYLLQFGDQTEYVLRRPPLGPVAPKSHDMGREYRVLSVLYQALPVAPRAYHLCEDSNIIGAPFQILERRRGVVIRTQMPPTYAEQPQSARQLSEALIDRLADFHAVDYQALGLGDLGKADGFLQRQVEGWYGRWQKAKAEDSAAFEAVYQWLQANLPPSQGVSLVHNDYKLDNTMFDPSDPSHMVAIFDWDMCTLGDPLSDLGTLLTYWTEESDPQVAKGLLGMPSAKYGFLTRAELIQRYAQRSGRDVSYIRFYQVLGLYRLIVIIAQIYIRYQRGQTQDERFAAFGAIIPIFAELAEQLTRSE